MKQDDKVYIFDTTLRDGEQALRRTLSPNEKVTIARAISKLNVDVLEVGFPASSPEEFKSVQEISRQISGPIICALARAVPEDVIACGESLKYAARKRIHIFIATSPIHLQNKLNISLKIATEKAVSAIKIAKNYTDDIEFGCEDATRTPVDDLCFIIKHAILAGATTINLADTVGYTTPKEFSLIVTYIKANVPNIHQVVLSVHCHNDLGLAVANTAEALSCGVRQIECTVNGIGERAGNCALEEIVMLLDSRSDYFGLSTAVNTKLIQSTSQLVSKITKLPIPYNKAIVGSNAFSHSSGIHQHGILKSNMTYEVFDPSKVGIDQNELYLTARSGRHAVKHFMNSLDVMIDTNELDDIYKLFLDLADKKGCVYWHDLKILFYSNQMSLSNKYYKLISVSVNTTLESMITIDLVLAVGNQICKYFSESSHIGGALEQLAISCYPLNLLGLIIKFSDVVSCYDVSMIIDFDGDPIYGEGNANDASIAVVKAYINVLNIAFVLGEITQMKARLQL